MKRVLPIILLLILTTTAFGQSWTVEAIYYDNDELPYKIEQKFSNNNETTYLTHDNKNSICLKRNISNKNDTTIVTETFYEIVREREKIEKFLDCDSWMVSSFSDTVVLTGFISFLVDTPILVGDTVLTGDAAKNSWNFSEQIKKARVPLILANSLTVSKDSLIPKESTCSYFINDILVKSEVFNSKGIRHSIAQCELSKDKMIWTSYFTKDTIKAYQVDTITWSKDTSDIIWHTKRFDEIDYSGTRNFKIRGTKLIVYFSNSTHKEIEYIDFKNIFQNILTGNFVYGDEYYYMELRYFDREKIVSIKSERQLDMNEFTYDNEGRITNQVSYNNGKRFKRVTYNYKDE